MGQQVGMWWLKVKTKIKIDKLFFRFFKKNIVVLLGGV